MDIDKNRLVEEFIRLVSIDSLSFQERKMADYLKEVLCGLGFQVEEDKAGSFYNGSAGNVYAFKKGTMTGEPLLFSSHMDTVVPGIGKKAIVQQDGRITSDGTTILGADDCSGIAAILEAVRTIVDKEVPHRSLELLFPIAEEVYLRGTEVFDFKKIQSKEAYVLDLSGPIGEAAYKAPTLLGFEFRIHGKAAHAGFAPETGINAIAIAASFISNVQQGRIDEETTVNIGTIEGGLATNIVSENCVIKGEVRSFDHDKAERILDSLIKRAKELTELAGAEFSHKISVGCIAYEVEHSASVIRRFEAVCKELEILTNLTKTFGGSDNNNFVRHGIEGIVLACGMNQVHSCEENTSIEELEKITNIVVRLMISEV